MHTMERHHVYKYTLFLVIFMTYYVSMNNGCLEQERVGLLGLRQLLESNGLDSSNHLPSWTENSEIDCCEWERVTCDNTTGHVTELYLSNLNKDEGTMNQVWTINCSLFLPLSELRTLNLSFNYFTKWEKNSGFERLSALKKLEAIDLSTNNFDDKTIYHSLGAITSLKTLLLSKNGFGGSFPAHELVGLENLEILDLSYSSYEDWLPKKGFDNLSVFRKLEALDFGFNYLTVEVLPYLNLLTSLKVLSLRGNEFGGSFPAQEISNLTNLESLDLSVNGLSGIQGLESLKKFKNLTSLDISSNGFNRSLLQTLSPLTSLKNLFLSSSNLGDPFPAKELTFLENLEMLDLSSNDLSSLTEKDCELLSTWNKMRRLDLTFNGFGKGVFRILDAIPSLRFMSLTGNHMEGPLSNQDLTYNHSRLEVLLLNGNYLNGSLPVEGLASLRFLKVLDLKGNNFFGSIPASIGALSSLKVLSLASNEFNGSLPEQGLCELTKLKELDLSNNRLQGTLPPCLSNLKSLRYLDISLNNFTGNLSSSLVSGLSSLECIDLSHNLFEGTFSFSSMANHSKLVVFEISSDNGKLEVETEEVEWVPMFQLKVLVLKNCNLNRLSKQKIPKFLLHQRELLSVDLSNNNLNDLFPNWLLVNNTGLGVFNVRKNFLFGPFLLPSVHYTDALDFSDNHLSGEIQANIGNVLPFVSLLNLSNNAFEGRIPSSIGETFSLCILDLSNNNLSGEVPRQLVRNQTPLEVLLLSNNSLNGQLFSASFNLTRLKILQLGDNQFTGPLAGYLFNSELSYLDVRNNLFSGEVSNLTERVVFTKLGTLILRNNYFVGEFPCSLVPDEFMDISFNSFSGPISSCLNQKLIMLKHLHLQGNKFTGFIPQEFLNSSVLLTLDISDNSFSGTIPMILAPLPELRILLSRGNQLNGSIPSHLCQLKKLSLMDLSNNLFTGTIPRCLSNISFGSIAGYDHAFLQYPINNLGFSSLYDFVGILTHQLENHDESITYSKSEEVNFITKSWVHPYQGNILNYMSGLDLSCNKLTGEIPTEIGELSAIRALNLSHNHLSRTIPKSLSNLKQVESLDLSYNMLKGSVPMEFTNLYFLAVFSVAYNNLSGTIPYGKAQFGTFNASSYEGNPNLCGPPLVKSCHPIVGKQDMPKDVSDESDGEWFGVDRVVLAIFGGAFITFFIGTLTVLYINPNWRRWLFRVIDDGLYSCYFCFVNLCKKLRG